MDVYQVSCELFTSVMIHIHRTLIVLKMNILKYVIYFYFNFATI